MITQQPHRPSPVYLRALPTTVRERPWYRRHSVSSVVGVLALTVTIAASFIYVVRVEAAHEADAVHRTP